MSEKVVEILSHELNITPEQASALWLHARKAATAALAAGSSVDLGFAYITPEVKSARRRYDFSSQTTVVTPRTHGLKLLLPPHMRDVLAGKAKPHPLMYATRTQLRRVTPEEQRDLEAENLNFYRLKGVSSS